MASSQPQLFDGKVPLSTSTLALFLEFDISACPSDLHLRDHAAAAQHACKDSRLRESAVVAARSCVVTGEADVAAAQALPRTDAWHREAENDKHVRLEFVYSTSRRQLCIRVLNNLSFCDGVTAVRPLPKTTEAGRPASRRWLARHWLASAYFRLP
jgi:hypothetical protein